MPEMEILFSYSSDMNLLWLLYSLILFQMIIDLHAKSQPWHYYLLSANFFILTRELNLDQKYYKSTMNSDL